MENDHVKDRTEQRSRCAHIKTFGAGRLYCCTVVRHSSTKSLKSSQVYSCLKLLLGHVARIPDHLIPKQFFYGELSQGKRSHGGQKKRYKDMLKASLNTLDIDSTSCFQSLMVDCPCCGWYPPEAFYQLPSLLMEDGWFKCKPAWTNSLQHATTWPPHQHKENRSDVPASSESSIARAHHHSEGTIAASSRPVYIYWQHPLQRSDNWHRGQLQNRQGKLCIRRTPDQRVGPP